MAQADFYDVLGVGRDADDGEIKTAFRKKAMQYHKRILDFSTWINTGL